MKKVSAILLIVLLMVFQSASQSCQPNSEICPTRMEDYHEPTVTTDDVNRYVTSTGCPPYPNPNWMNPNSACTKNTTYTIPLRPRFSAEPVPVGVELSRFDNILYLMDDPAPILGAIGVLVNGVIVFGRGSPCGAGSQCPGQGTEAPSSFVDAVDSEGRTIDQCGGHPQMTGEYHIHSAVTFMNSSGRQMCRLPVDTPGEHSILLGWMFDGFPMYGQYSQNGVLPTMLDDCHGHTHEIDGVMTYHYHMPLSYPHIIGCFKGCPVASNNRRQLRPLVNQYCANGGLEDDPNPVFEVAGNNSALVIKMSDYAYALAMLTTIVFSC